jgi:dsRNA-specific ribonuclease
MFHRSHSLTLVPLLALALLSGSCQSTTEGKGTATGKNITRAADAIQTGIGQLDATMTAHDWKTQLQEQSQAAFRTVPEYRLVEERGRSPPVWSQPWFAATGWGRL